ncbi:30404_t:CDS:2, partial [Racocetra persica]
MWRDGDSRLHSSLVIFVRMKWEPEREIFSAGGEEDQGKTRHDLVRGDKK